MSVSMDIRLPPRGSQQYELEVTQNYERSPWHVRIHSLEWDPAIDEDGRIPMEVRRLDTWAQVLKLIEDLKQWYHLEKSE